MSELIIKNITLLDTFVDDDIRKMSMDRIQDLLSIIEYLLGLDRDDSNDNLFNVMTAHYEASGMNTHPGANMFARVYSVLTNIMGRAHELANRTDDNILIEKCRDITDKDMTFSERWNRDRTMLHYLDQYTKAHTMFRHCHKNNGSYAENTTTIWSMDPYDPTNLDGCNDFQIALLDTLRRIWEQNYKKYQVHICKEVKTVEGYSTRAWEVMSTIEEYVYRTCDKELHPELWKKMTKNGGVFSSIANLLEKQKDMQFPDIVKCRHLWSFKNGLLFGKQWSPDQGAYISKFYPYDSTQCLNLDPTMVSSKYFDLDFVDHSGVKDWYDIPTPNMQQVLDYQRFPKEQARWMYIMGGRLCFEVGDLDRWQVIPFLKGIAKSGKSTLLTKVFEKFYAPEDVSVMSNKVEEKFGLHPMYKSFVFIAPEIKRDFSLDQAEFQSIVSGEGVSVRCKGEKAISMIWKTPGILAGNEIPDWRDNSGSIMRRILPFDFMRQVRDADTELELRLEKELPVILEKCLRAYTECVAKAGKKDIWKIVPPEFLVAQREMAAATNVLTEYLGQPYMVYGKDKVIPFKNFRIKFYEYCSDTAQTKPRGFTAVNKEYWIGPFQHRDIEVELSRDEFIYNGRKMKNELVIRGVDIEDSYMNNDDH